MWLVEHALTAAGSAQESVSKRQIFGGTDSVSGSARECSNLTPTGSPWKCAQHKRCAQPIPSKVAESPRAFHYRRLKH